jgi:hypothetical protein
MSLFPKAALVIAVFFAVICFIVCSFFMSFDLALMLGLFTGAIYYIVFAVIELNLSQKATKLLEGLDEDFLYKHIVNYYSGRLVGAGWLFLTKTALFFKDIDKIKAPPLKILHSDIADIKYEAVFRHIKGMTVTTTDGSIYGFALAPKEFDSFKTAFHAARYGTN